MTVYDNDDITLYLNNLDGDLGGDTIVDVID